MTILAFLYDLNLKIKVDTVVSQIYFDSKYHAKCKFASKFIQLVTITDLFPFEVVQRCQHCQLCPLPENSKLSIVDFRIRKWPLTIHGLPNIVLNRIYESATVKEYLPIAPSSCVRHSFRCRIHSSLWSCCWAPGFGQNRVRSMLPCCTLVSVLFRSSIISINFVQASFTVFGKM